MDTETGTSTGSRGRGRPPVDAVPKKSGRFRLGAAIRAMREAEGVSLRAFSASLGNYSPGHLSRVERGLTAPSQEFVEACESQLDADGLLLSLYELVKADQAEYRLLSRARGNSANGEREATPSRTRPGDRSEFVSDLLLVDGERVKCGERLTKSWRIRNAGAVPWVGRLLRRDGPLAGPGIIESPRTVPIPTTAPGETVDLEVAIRAPNLPGTTKAYWRMTDSDGSPCFPDRYAEGIYVLLVVVN